MPPVPPELPPARPAPEFEAVRPHDGLVATDKRVVQLVALLEEGASAEQALTGAMSRLGWVPDDSEEASVERLRTLTAISDSMLVVQHDCFSVDDPQLSADPSALAELARVLSETAGGQFSTYEYVGHLGEVFYERWSGGCLQSMDPRRHGYRGQIGWDLPAGEPTELVPFGQLIVEPLYREQARELHGVERRWRLQVHQPRDASVADQRVLELAGALSSGSEPPEGWQIQGSSRAGMAPGKIKLEGFGILATRHIKARGGRPASTVIKFTPSHALVAAFQRPAAQAKEALVALGLPAVEYAAASSLLAGPGVARVGGSFYLRRRLIPPAVQPHPDGEHLIVVDGSTKLSGVFELDAPDLADS